MPTPPTQTAHATEQTDHSDAICPYCDHRFQVETEDYQSDGESTTIECDGCGMRYHLTQSYDVTHTSTPDCELNGQAHDFQIRPKVAHRFCSRCDKCEPLF